VSARDELHSLLVCPKCRGALGWEESVATCQVCASTFSIEAGIPVLLATSLEDQPYKLRQADSYILARSEFFERTRPRGAPRFYGLLMQEKLSRSISALRGELDGARAVVICAGSGMDAEFLARQGLPTLALDVSLGACKRAHRRAEETGLPILPVVADAENLPLRDASVELAYVHDGLHHLENYFGGLREMMRVARSAVSLTEPTRAIATAILIRAGISEEVEESGNDVHRVPIPMLVRFLTEHDFTPVGTDRYAMYYQHEPGPIVRVLSRGRLAPPSLAAFRVANGLLGRVGNKMSVQAVRKPPSGLAAPNEKVV
jgi:uncharacterized protein YbaR (Trm112 family)